MESIGMIYDEYMHDRSSYCSPATLVKYKDDLTIFFNYIGGNQVTFNDLSLDVYRDFIVHLRNTGIKNSSIRSYCRSVKAFLRWAYEKDLCPDYLKGVKLPRSDAAPQLPLYTSEVKRIDDSFNTNREPGIRNYCIIHLMLDCGLRRQEVIHLKIEDILFDRNIIQILDSKGNKSRLVLIPDRLLKYIRKYMSAAHCGTGYLFRSLRGDGPLTEEAVDKLFQDLKKDADIPRLHAHLLRHTFATSYLIGGGNLEFLRVFLGHTDYSVTKVYSSMAAQLKILGADIYKLDPIFFTHGY